MDTASALRTVAISAVPMIILAASCEYIASSFGIFGIIAFALEGAFILVAGAYSGRNADAVSGGMVGAILGLVCAFSASAARWLMIYLMPTKFAPALNEAAMMMIADAASGGAFWAVAGFALGVIGAVFAQRSRIKTD